MKILAAFIALMPAAVLAHGPHAPVAETAHGMAHAGLNAGLAVIAVALIAGVVRRLRS